VSLAPGSRVPNPIEIGAWRLWRNNPLGKHRIPHSNCVQAKPCCDASRIVVCTMIPTAPHIGITIEDDGFFSGVQKEARL
jgi:hypothetical protein